MSSEEVMSYDTVCGVLHGYVSAQMLRKPNDKLPIFFFFAGDKLPI
jgi:hypothetical protein